LVAANTRYLACQISNVSAQSDMPESATVLPNPTTGFFQLKTDIPWQQAVMYNEQGTLLRRFSFYEQEKMNLNGFPAGVYTLEVFFEKNKATQVLRVVKQ
jgi:hypothetical protein